METEVKIDQVEVKDTEIFLSNKANTARENSEAKDTQTFKEKEVSFLLKDKIDKLLKENKELKEQLKGKSYG